MAAAARQFYENFLSEECMCGVTKAYHSISVPIPCTRPIHRRNVDPGAVHKPVLKESQAQTVLINYPKEERAHIGDYNPNNGSKKYSVATDERQKPTGAVNGGELGGYCPENVPT